MEEKVVSIKTVDTCVDIRFSAIGILVSGICFQLLNRYIKRTAIPSVLMTDHWRYANILTSWWHAVLIGIWTTSSLLFYPRLLGNPLTFFSHFVYWMVVMSAGYFWYDFIDGFRHKTLFSALDIALHHIMTMGLFMYNILSCQCLGLNTVALLPEINSIFLHGRRLLIMRKVDFNSRLFWWNKWINLATFVVFRFGVNIYLLHGLFNDGWFETIPSWFYKIGFPLSGVIWTTMNFVIFYRLVKSDVLRRKTKDVNSKLKQMINNNNGKFE